jgi:large subunit ribosomal protein L7/L12
MPRRNLQQKLEAAKKKKSQLDNQIKLIRAELSTIERKKDTRRKILLGALVMHLIDKGVLEFDWVMRHLDKFLTKERDGIEPRSV